MAVVEAGQPAPDFTLRTSEGEEFTREQLLGRTTVLVFYPFAFSPVCTDQLSLYNDLLEDFSARGATLYGVSCDASPSQIESLDMGRRGLHNEGTELLIKRLNGKIETDFDTARRLFTLICVLHLKV